MAVSTDNLSSHKLSHISSALSWLIIALQRTGKWDDTERTKTTDTILILLQPNTTEI